MDLKPRTPLPPGMVPSASREDLSDILEKEQMKDQETKNIIQEVSLSSMNSYSRSSVTNSISVH